MNNWALLLGLQFYGIPYEYVNSDPDMVSVQKQSLSRLEYIDIKFAGYDGYAYNMLMMWHETVVEQQKM